jgi:hypothetical protein
MAIESITCPNCGNTGIQIDTAREHSVCSYCGSTLKTKDVLHLDVESMTLSRLKSNAQRSFDVGQYGNARADWEKALQIDRTDHESYFGIVRCKMASKPNEIIGKSNTQYKQALTYAPAEVSAEYRRLVDAHNAPISARMEEETARQALERQERDERMRQEREKEKQENAKQMKLLAIIAAAVAGIVVLLISINAISKLVRYNAAVGLFEKGQFSQAVEKFAAFGVYRDSESYADYCSAINLFENRQYAEAGKLFVKLGDFLDSEEYLTKGEVAFHVVGNKVSFGEHKDDKVDWIIIDADGSRSLLLMATSRFAVNNIGSRYNDAGYHSINEGLIEKFCEIHFNGTEQKALIETEIFGDAYTLFFLSEDEVKRYDIAKPVYRDINGKEADWAIRSSDSKSLKYVYTYGISSSPAYGTMHLRVAVWIDTDLLPVPPSSRANPGS